MPQASHIQVHEVDMEYVDIPGTPLRVSRVALGTWAMGGWMWGGTDERESVKTVWAALDQGINLIDTAPAYGAGVSESLVGKALTDAGLRARAVIATKVGVEMHDGKAYRNATRQR
ncbi:MAG: aldo/keto reductase, partial [Acidobacteriota bacterium]|nr:aldo/keto reductase [Acidobacteriota bacterium]